MYKINRLVTALKLYRGVQKYGYTLLALLYAVKSDKRFISIGSKRYTYERLFQKSLEQAYFFQKTFHFRSRKKVILVGNQSEEWLISLIALSGLGSVIHLINPKLKSYVVHQTLDSIENYPIFANQDTIERLDLINAKVIKLSSLDMKPSKRFIKSLSRKKASIVNLSSGTSGLPTTEERTFKIKPFLSPFFFLLQSLKLDKDKNALIGIPCSHGYGLAALILGMALKKDIYLSRSEKETFNILNSRKKNNIDCWISLPTQLENYFKILEDNKVIPAKIITGSEPINASLVKHIQSLGVDLYNLYGTTETGVLSIATPEMLELHPTTLGHPIRGVEYQFRNQDNNGFAELWVKSPWSGDTHKSNFVATGDKIREDEYAYWFYGGRNDQRILINGYLVNPKEVQTILSDHFPDLEMNIQQIEDTMELKIKAEGLDTEIKEKTVQDIKKLLPKHFMPAKIEWV